MFINLTNIDFCPSNGGSGEEVKLQNDKSITYTANGNYTIQPDTGYDGLSSVGVAVNVDTTPHLQSKSSTYTTNGTYTINPDDGYDGLSTAEVVVNVPSTPGGTDYRYQTGTVDFDGLKAIGWDDTSINYFNANALHYPWENDEYKVSDGNKAIQIEDGVVSKYASDPNFVYCPYFDTSRDTDMSYKFANFKFLRSIPSLNTSNVTSMYQMFSNCPNLQTISPIDTSSVTEMSQMFSQCSSLQIIPELDTSKVTSMSMMFYYCSSLQSIPQLDTSKVTEMGGMFYGCSELQKIESLDMSNVTVTSSDGWADMFGDCYQLSYIRLTGSLNVSLNIAYTTLLDYDSVKSILTAASNTVNTDSKTLSFESTLTDQNGELAGLVATCTSKGWTVNGLTLN